MYNIDVNKKDKTVTAVVDGFFNQETAQNYVADLQKTANSVSAKDYVFVVDASNVSVTKTDLVEKLKETFKLYLSFGFKKVAIVKSKSPTAVLQGKKIIKSENLPIQIVDSIKEGQQL